MKKPFKIAILIFSIVLVLFSVAYFYIYNTSARNIQSEEAKYIVNSTDIVNEFMKNSQLANQKYLEKPVAISGKVTSVIGSSVILDQSINCVFEKNDPSIKENMTIQVKGRVIGYDDLLSELKIDMCNQIK